MLLSLAHCASRKVNSSKHWAVPTRRRDQLFGGLGQLIDQLVELGPDHERAIGSVRVVVEVILVILLRRVELSERNNLRDDGILELSRCFFLRGFRRLFLAIVLK